VTDGTGMTHRHDPDRDGLGPLPETSTWPDDAYPPMLAGAEEAAREDRALGRHDVVRKNYVTAAYELTMLRVEAVEEAISREHSMWIARKQGSDWFGPALFHSLKPKCGIAPRDSACFEQ